MFDTNKIRLESLRINFRDKENAKRGYSDFLKLKDDEFLLSTMLRNHNELEIDTNELVIFRDDIDFLIDYFGILAAGIYSGYIERDLPASITTEAREFLGNKAVEKFYTDHYPLALPQLLYNQIVLKKEISCVSSGEKDAIFEEALLLIRTRMEDEDIDGFLFLLDNGFFTYEGEDIGLGSILRILKSTERIRECVNSANDETVVHKSLLIGFSKFIQYACEYSKLLRSSPEDPDFRSILWHLDGYWFEKLSEKEEQIYEGIANLQSTLQAGIIEGTDEEDFEIIKEWENDIPKTVKEIYADLDFITNKKIKAPVWRLIDEDNSKSLSVVT